MNHLPLQFFLGFVFIILLSCTATNNLYLNDPVPVGKGNIRGYIGIGTGTEAKIDSVSSFDHKVHFSDKIAITPFVLSAGFQSGISARSDLRVAIHVPKIIGGFGFRIGAQHSFLDAQSKVNMALGADFGYAFSRDSIRILGSNSEIEKSKNGIINMDLFLPFSITLKNDFIMVLTPRYSLNRFYIREFQDVKKAKPFKLGYPALTLGFDIKKIYAEVSMFVYDKSLFPHFGLAYRM